MTTLVCWRCGGSLHHVPQPLVRLAQCPACGADLHVCRLCKFYNPRHSDKCDHDLAEPAREIDVANFCHYFRPRPGAYNTVEHDRAEDAMAQLKALFGDSEDTTAPSTSPQAEAEDDKAAAKARFDDLFKKD